MQPSRELQSRCKSIAERLSESLHIVDHDPSMALYRLQEHVSKSVPVLVNRKYEMMKLNSVLQGACYDIDNSMEAMKEMQKASSTFERILEMLRESTHVKQQMDYEKEKTEKRWSNSMEEKLGSRTRRVGGWCGVVGGGFGGPMEGSI
ncbi:hypothetical protein FO519_008046 [Halicephalobus sp. NKZ332]|nr:hypothetical protein FO519_008046 [Halicephalobus sp. NKZ332]